MANFGLFEVHKIVSEYAERVHCICVHGKDAKIQVYNAEDISVNNGPT
jgi:hypothetical protein